MPCGKCRFILHKRKKPQKESVSKIIKDSVEILDTHSTSGHVLTKSASLTGHALFKSAKFTLLKGPLALDYLCIACLSILFYHYYGNFY